MTASISATLRRERRIASPLRPGAAVWASLGLVVIWAAWAAFFNTAQFGDNIEQFNWAQSFELGYHKHPPLPTWLLGAAIRLLGPSVYWAYALAAACLLGTATFTWLIGRRLVGERVAAATVVLWGLNMGFSQRAQLYNHNTVLVLCIAATVWLAMRASASTRRSGLWWVATGAAAACAFLSKYQALVPLAGLVVGLVLSGGLRAPRQRYGLLLSIAVMVLLCVPHLVWVVHHDFSTLRYASEAVESSTLAQRGMFILSFFANQLRIQSPALLAIALCAALARWLPTRAPVDTPPHWRDAAYSTWMFGLLGGGLLVLAVMALVAGVGLRNHWGVQALQFFCVWLAAGWDRRSPIDLRRLLGVALLIHAACLGFYAAEHRDPAGVLNARRIDTLYPARRLAQVAVAHWSASTPCPLHFVAGTVFDAGLVALYAGGKLSVFDSAAATPWVRADDLRREGALYVLDGDDPVPPGVTNIIPFPIALGDRSGRPAKTLRIGIRIPEMSCAAGIRGATGQ